MSAFGPFFAAALFVELTIAVVGSSLGALDTAGKDVDARASGRRGRSASCCSPSSSWPFEAASFLLLVAAVGAVVLARKRRGLEDAESGAVSVGEVARGDVADGHLLVRRPLGLHLLPSAPPACSPAAARW